MIPLVLHCCKRDGADRAIVDKYIELRNGIYSKLQIPYTDTEIFFDTRPDTEFVIALQGDKVVGGGRLIHRKPNSNFSLSIDSQPFQKLFYNCLAKGKIPLAETHFVETGGVAVKDTVDPTHTVGFKIQSKLAEVANKSSAIVFAKVDQRNILSVIRGIQRHPDSIRTIIVPEKIQYYGNTGYLMFFTNNKAYIRGFDKLVADGIAQSPNAFMQKCKESTR